MYTKEQILERFRKVHGDRYSYDHFEYTRLIDPSWITCKIHGDFKQSAHAHIKGQGCPKCGILQRAAKHSSNTDEFVEKAKKIHGDSLDFSKVNYVNNRTPTTFICPKHGEFEMKPGEVLNGRGCPKCGALRRMDWKRITKDEFIKRSRAVHGDKYDYNNVKCSNINTKVCIICPEHGEFWQTPGMHMIGQGCPKCGKIKRAKSRTKTTYQFIEDARKVHGDKYSYEHTMYEKCDKPVIITCPIHGDFEQVPYYHLSGNGCQKCAEEMTESAGEMEMRDFIIGLVGEDNCRIHDRSVLRGYELDIVIPSMNIAFEYDGIYWHSDAKKQDMNYHLNKSKACVKKGIRLIHVFEDEWLDKNEICRSRIRSVLGLYDRRIYARKCKIEEIDASVANGFVRENHIQGVSYAKYNYGLFYDGELVSVMTFCALRKNLGSVSKEGSYELLRFCNKVGVSVVGGASRLFKKFLDDVNPDIVISYADKRWSDGNLYYKLGFRHIHDSKPSYFYIINGERKNRFGYRKNILVEKYGCPKDMSERDFCTSKGWYRIYDCGSMKFIYMKNEVSDI